MVMCFKKYVGQISFTSREQCAQWNGDLLPGVGRDGAIGKLKTGLDINRELLATVGSPVDPKCQIGIDGGVHWFVGELKILIVRHDHAHRVASGMNRR